MSIDRVAATGFGAGAGAYERARPGYPTDAVAWLIDRLGLGPESRLVELGAGTGKLTSSIAAAGLSIVAVEPVEAMRRELVTRMPRVDVVAATAEAIPLAAECADGVVAAQAFHWFDAPRALEEIRRVLRRGGGLGLVWNARDTSVAWVGEMASILDAYGDAIRRHESGEWRAAFPAPGFGPLEEASFSNVQTITPGGILDRVASTSFIARLPDDERSSVLDRMRALLETHPQTAGKEVIEFPHRTQVFRCERL